MSVSKRLSITKKLTFPKQLPKERRLSLLTDMAKFASVSRTKYTRLP